MTSFRLNGSEVTVDGEHEHLLTALRDELGVLSPKDGCAPSGQCGCCTVLVDGKARVACQTSLERADGTSIVTLEGLDADEAERYAAAFAANGALQCGFCTPGIVARAKAMIDKSGPELSRDQAARLLGAHLCRCTGYVKILDAIEDLARGETPVAIEPKGVGSRGVKYEAAELSLGSRPFIDDMTPDPTLAGDLLHGAVHLSAHARADIVAIDTGPAEAVPGVVRVFTGADVPGELRHGLIHKDWPALHPRRRPHQLPGRCPGPGRGRGPTDRPEGGRADRRHLRAARTGDRPRGRGRPGGRGTGRGVDPRRQHPVPLDLRPGRRRGGAGRGGPRRLGDVPDPAHRPCLRRAGVDPGRPRAGRAGPAPDRRHDRPRHPGRRLRPADGLQRGPGHLGRPERHRPHPRRRPVGRRDRARLERRSLRGQGGHVQPGPDRPGRLAAAAPGPDHLLP